MSGMSLHVDGFYRRGSLSCPPLVKLKRDTMIERTRAGLAAAAANGRKGGRPRKVDGTASAKARTHREKGINAPESSGLEELLDEVDGEGPNLCLSSRSTE